MTKEENMLLFGCSEAVESYPFKLKTCWIDDTPYGVCSLSMPKAHHNGGVKTK